MKFVEVRGSVVEIASVNYPKGTYYNDGFFAYEDGHFVMSANLRKATEFTDNRELFKALEYARIIDPEAAPVCLSIGLDPINIGEDELRRERALSKLTKEDKIALGLK